MALSIFQRPLNYRIDSSSFETGIYTNGSAVITESNVISFIGNETIYIISGQNQGFWLAKTTGANTFQIYSVNDPLGTSGTAILFVGNGTFNYYRMSTTGFKNVGVGTTWIISPLFGAFVTFPSSPLDSAYLVTNYGLLSGISYSFRWNVSTTDISSELKLVTMDSSNNILETIRDKVNPTEIATFSFTPTITCAKLAFIAHGDNPCTVSIGFLQQPQPNSLYFSNPGFSWNCVHLPIVYKLQSTSYPNIIDTARTITTFSNYNGYTYINASGDIKTTGTASSLEKVILTGTSVDGIYSIIKWLSDTNFVISLPYSAGNVLSSGTVQYYYNNYCARIRIYAGIFSTHTLTAQKPVALMTEIRMVPDSTGVITLNISEFIKSKLNLLYNDLLKSTLPNNIDAWCNFYITYAESYDDSNMYTVSEFVSAYTDDSTNFVGTAVNAKLPFQTQSSGVMSAYVSGLTSATQQAWLTDFNRPMIPAGKYWDISYIKNSSSSGDYIKADTYQTVGGNYVLIASTLYAQTNFNQGVYRFTINGAGGMSVPIGNISRVDLTYYNSSNTQLSQTITCDVDQKCSFSDYYITWLNYLGGFNYWNFKAKRGKKYSIDVIDSQTQDQNIFNNWPASYGEFADSITKQTLRRTKNRVTVSSQLLTAAQEDAIKLITSSPLVQLITDQYHKKTVLITPDTLDIRQDRDKSLSLSFQIMDTDEIPSQSL